MANLAVTTAGVIHSVGIPIQQHTFPAAEAILAGDACRIDTSTGRATKANGTVAGEARIWGVSLNSAAAGEPVTLVRRGFLSGYTLSQAYDAAIYLSDTDGLLGDTAGTVSTLIGRVVPGFANIISGSADKILSVEL